MKILIVEDDLTSRFVLQKMLTPYGECNSVVNGREAVEAFKLALDEKKPYDLICLDIMMHEMDGRTALRLIRQIEKENNIHAKDEVKIVMMTALDSPEEVFDAYYKGACTHYLVKPIEKQKLLNVLEELELIKK
ncbi:MAG: response regulator [Ignavibacteriaceae bacterium]|nr:response regulator [Ignavibacteriaceae bacterium]HRI47616.1 response regulator [Ignavibacteriaceae bacterium]